MPTPPPLDTSLFKSMHNLVLGVTCNSDSAKSYTDFSVGEAVVAPASGPPAVKISSFLPCWFDMKDVIRSHLMLVFIFGTRYRKELCK